MLLYHLGHANENVKNDTYITFEGIQCKVVGLDVNYSEKLIQNRTRIFFQGFSMPTKLRILYLNHIKKLKNKIQKKLIFVN